MVGAFRTRVGLLKANVKFRRTSGAMHIALKGAGIGPPELGLCRTSAPRKNSGLLHLSSAAICCGRAPLSERRSFALVPGGTRQMVYVPDHLKSRWLVRIA